MLHVHDSLTWLQREYSIFIPPVLAVTLLIFAVMSILEYFKPVGKRKAKNGKRPLLPPGPPTRPLFGNLLQFKGSKGDPFHKQVRLSWVYPIRIHFLVGPRINRSLVPSYSLYGTMAK